MESLFKIQNPKTFDKPTNACAKVGLLFKNRDKVNFISEYKKLSNSDKFYTLSTILLIDAFNDLSVVKNMFLEELRSDLMILKILNDTNNLNELKIDENEKKYLSEEITKFGSDYIGCFFIDNIDMNIGEMCKIFKNEYEKN